MQLIVNLISILTVISALQYNWFLLGIIYYILICCILAIISTIHSIAVSKSDIYNKNS
jgi:hypothetical protein